MIRLRSRLYGLCLGLATALPFNWLSPQVASACDICAIYTATELRNFRLGLSIGAAEQFSRFTTLRDNGQQQDNPNDERLESSITQFILRYNLHPRLGVQINAPIITRNFRRLEPEGVVSDDENGPGDLSLLANFVAFSTVREESLFRLSLHGGIKLPTGSSSRLREELTDDDAHDTPFSSRLHPRHNDGASGTEGGLHGHDLALGTGSVDGLFGISAFSVWKRGFATLKLQYLLRSEGSYDYEYADEISWNGGPGVFLLAQHNYTLGLQMIISGDTKGTDRLKGQRVGDTGFTGLYLGPGLQWSWNSLSVDLAGDIPVVQNNTALQLVPDFRIRGGIVWSF